MKYQFQEWNNFVLSPPPHVSIDGTFSDQILNKQIRLATAANVKASDDHCHNEEIPFSQFLHRLSYFRAGKKDGPMFTQGSVVDNHRSKNSMQTMSLIAADVDNGRPIDDVIARVKAAGIAAAIVTSHSHGVASTEIDFEEFCKWRGSLAPEFTDDEVQDFLRQRSKHHESVIASMSRAERTRTRNGWVLNIVHGPMDKFRVVGVLNRWIDFDAYPTLQDANRDWSAAATGFGKMLGIEIDKACKDSSRAYYYGSHPVGSDIHETIYIKGNAIDFDVLAALGASPLEVTSATRTAAPKEKAVIVPPSQRFASRLEIERASASGVAPNPNANRRWAATYAPRFEIVAALRAHAPDLLGSSANQGKGVHLRRCPMCERHSHPDQEDTATYVLNASANGRSGFAIRCMHAGCQDTDRLDFLQRLIDAAVLPAEAITDAAFLIADPSDRLLEQIAQEFPLPPNKGNLTYVIL